MFVLGFLEWLQYLFQLLEYRWHFEKFISKKIWCNLWEPPPKFGQITEVRFCEKIYFLCFLGPEKLFWAPKPWRSRWWRNCASKLSSCWHVIKECLICMSDFFRCILVHHQGSHVLWKSDIPSQSHPIQCSSSAVILNC